MVFKIYNFVYIFIILFVISCEGRGKEHYFEKCNLTSKLKNEIRSYAPIVNRIIWSAVSGPSKGQTWKELANFVDTFGSRIAGSQNLENAIDYMLNKSVTYGLENVHGEPVQVPHWVRGNEQATLLSPRIQKLNILGLGGSIGTPPGGLTAQVAVFETFDELKQKAAEAKGKIVVFAEKWEGYGKTVQYRQYAAKEGAKVGAVATLIRSVTPFSLNSPHTGWQDYDINVPKIPTAAITVEDAMTLLRMYRQGRNITINLLMEAKTLDPVQSRNTVVEIKGSKRPEKSVIVSGHLDSWDVGTGAMDDGGGAFISWYSLVLLKQLNLRPKRTVRAILWTGEEEGLIGAFQYAKDHDKNSFSLLMESDEGTFNPNGIFFAGKQGAGCILQEVLKLLAPINATTVEPSSYVGSDITVWANQDVPLVALKNENENYFWYHHSDADRMVVEDSDNLDKCVALWASVAYVIADLSTELPR